MNTSLESLIKELQKERVHSHILEAFLIIDRKDFVPQEMREFSYEDRPLPIGFGQTISEPYTVAFMLELLRPNPGDEILDIGSGSGWTTAILAFLAGSSARVIGLEIIPELVEFGRKNIEKYDFPNVEIRQAQQGIIGISGESFDRILVSASAAAFPDALLDQLKPGGKLVIPVGNSVFLYEKDESGRVAYEEFPGFLFVPLA